MAEDEGAASLAQVAGILGRPVDQLLELDRRPLRLAFVETAYQTLVVRDRATGETIEVTVDARTSEPADPAELRRLDADAAEEFAAVLSDDLRSLLLRHPGLPALQVAVTRGGATAAEPQTVSAAQIVDRKSVV